MGQNIADYSEKEWKEIKGQFEQDFANSLKYNKSFTEIISQILEGETYASFEEKTRLCPNQLDCLRKQVNAENPPWRKTLISVCVGYGLDLMMTQELLHSLGLELSSQNRSDYAYIFLLTRYRGKNIEKCNEILKGLGIEEKYWLGEYARK